MIVETRLLRLTSRRRYQMDLCAQEVVVGTMVSRVRATVQAPQQQ